ncbi:MAG: ATP synthase A1 subunit C [Thermoplasmata archaeon]|nr:ATP synthase A1 subunit C [Thermoplasmata archaeon]MBO5547351.1 ATP synthase A1 subunit C [Candidatus Methanomethylophilaceae archaeon]MBR4685016.1 ATP synthase A1 subunit C [Candidatus Methanomethylophilaceae archaeon]WII08109.1 ATP synthase A1 subunit C [Methanomassiliicoccales archaeon LGM-RCC1]
MFGRGKNKGNYAYTATRAKAMKALLIKEDDYNKMLQLGVSELARFTSEAGYAKEVTELADKTEGVDLVERATYMYLADTCKSLLQGAQGELYTLLASYLQKWDNWNVKVILRGKSYGLSVDNIRADLVPAGNMGAEELERLISLESSEEILTAYCKAEAIPLPADLLADYKQTGTLGRIEDYLDKVQYERLIRVIPTTSLPTRMFSDYIRRVVDMKNLETILKLKVEGVTGDKVMDYVIPGGKQIDMKFAKQLADAETVKDTYSDLAQLDFYDYFKELVEAGDMTVRDLILKMKKYEIEESKKFAKEYPLSILPAVDYMIGIENEVRNIRTIARGIESGLDKETIKGLLVI